MPTHISWSSIELLHNVIRTLAILKENTGAEPPQVSYRGKVKLHGTNCAVQITPDGVFAQSRTGMLTTEDDYKGFAKWVASHTSPGDVNGDGMGYFMNRRPTFTILGEWCGPGVEKGMAISQVKNKVFAVFAIQVGLGVDARVVYDPEEIDLYLGGSLPQGMYVLPWQGDEFSVDFTDRASIENAASLVNQRVAEVEREDPWVKTTLGVSGIGEGLVFYPVAVGGNPTAVPTDPEALAHLMWKAKGEKHRTAGTKEAVQVEPSVVASTGEFVSLMVTPARLEQGVSVACGGVREPKMTRNFLSWVSADVMKESMAELEVSGLTWPQVEKAVQAKAREWFLGQAG